MSKLFKCEICGKETNKLCECDSCYRSFCPDCGGVGDSLHLCNDCIEHDDEDLDEALPFECDVCGKSCSNLRECDTCGRMYCPDCGGDAFLCDECIERKSQNKSIFGA
jgi:hypothetical protein